MRIKTTLTPDSLVYKTITELKPGEKFTYTTHTATVTDQRPTPHVGIVLDNGKFLYVRGDLPTEHTRSDWRNMPIENVPWGDVFKHSGWYFIVVRSNDRTHCQAVDLKTGDLHNIPHGTIVRYEHAYTTIDPVR